MDEFLSLLENDDESDSLQRSSKDDDDDDDDSEVNNHENSNSRTNDSTITASHSSSSRLSMGIPTRSGQSTSGRIQKPLPPPPPPKPPSNGISSALLATVGVDEKLGIRMIQRHMSSLDLMDLITTTMNQYHSPAQLSAMSLHALCGTLIDPPSIIDKATVQGKTQLITVGIVFQNSGTKTSTKGGAFCILTIGSNLQTGPCVSIFLFGTAYTKFSRTCRAGHVIALCNPKLLPQKDQNGTGGTGGKHDNTNISFSVHDPSQLILVAQARDYGVCKATIRGKQPDGSWKENASTCQSFVDTRVSEYCAFHRKQHDQKQNCNYLASCSAMRGAGGVIRTQPSGGNLFQKLRAERSQTQEARRVLNGTNRFLMNPNTTAQQGNSVAASYHPPRDDTRIMTLPKTAGRTTATGMTFPGEKPKTSAMASIAMHMSKGVSVSNPPLKNDNQNPYSNRTSGKGVGTNRFTGKSVVSRPPREVTPMKVTGDWLQDAVVNKVSSQSLSTRSGCTMPSQEGSLTKKRKINTVGCGWDGAVAIPKPSALFQKSPAVVPRDRLDSHPNDVTREDKETAIKEKQSLIAQKIRESQSIQMSSSNPYNKSTSVQAKSSTTPGNAFLDSIHVDSVEEALNAKSRFATEADAEEYVKNRKRVVELEILETKQAHRKRQIPEKENQRIQKEWICLTCPNRPFFSYPPKQCINSGHKVSLKRMIKEATTKEDERSKLNEMAPDKGGLTLGRGLEWSKNRFSSN